MQLLIRVEGAGPGGPDPAANVGLKCYSRLAWPVSPLFSKPGADALGKANSLSASQELPSGWRFFSLKEESAVSHGGERQSRLRLALGVAAPSLGGGAGGYNQPPGGR